VSHKTCVESRAHCSINQHVGCLPHSQTHLLHHSFTVTRHDAPTKLLRTFGIIILFISLFFWAWAVWNTVTKQFDAGLVSFLLAAVSSTFLLVKGAPGKIGQWLIMGSFLLVALNYLAGAVLAFQVLQRPGFGIYCIVFTILWIVIACVGHHLIFKAQQEKTASKSNCEQDPIK